MRVQSVKVPVELAQQIEHFCMNRGMSKSEVVRRAINEYLDSRHIEEDVKNGPVFHPITSLLIFKMEKEDIDRLEEVSRRLGMSKSEVVRRAISKYFQKV